MAKTKAKGKVNQKSARPGKRLGLKAAAGQKVKVGDILVRQRGSTFHSGPGTKVGRDYTVYAMRRGNVKFKKRLGKKLICVQ